MKTIPQPAGGRVPVHTPQRLWFAERKEILPNRCFLNPDEIRAFGQAFLAKNGFDP
jgi:hypothetical protein